MQTEQGVFMDINIYVFLYIATINRKGSHEFREQGGVYGGG